MAREMKLNKKIQESQKVMWQQFLKYSEMLCGGVCKLIRTMFSIPSNTGWIKHA